MSVDKAQMHFDVFDGKTDYIPLVINIEPKEKVNITPWEAMQDPQRQIDAFVKNNEYNLMLPTDRVVSIESNFLECLIPSMFGAKPFASPGGWVDVAPVIDDLEDFEDVEITDGLLEQAEEHLRYLKNNVPENVHVANTRFMAPLDCGVVIRGSDFYLDLLCDPDLAMSFMNKVARISIDAMKRLKKVIGEPDDRQMNATTGYWIRGTRLTGDSIVNVSPDVIKNMLVPSMQVFKEELGGIILHYCCKPAPSGHVLPALCECGDIVRAVDNWQGYRTFFNENGDGMLQDKIGMCADFPISEVENVEKFMEQDIFSKVPRKGGRGFLVRTRAKTLDQAKALYDNWQNYFAKHGMLYS